jgi:alkylation response protein AidB-like acyl-CoA dehydrogenase
VLADAARRIADEVLFPDADRIDASPVVERRYLDELAAAGLYDLPGGTEGGRVIEALGGASLVTAFIWIQHHSPVRAVAAAGGSLADQWLRPLRRGQVRAGIAYAALRRPGPPAVVAEACPGGGWRLSGHAPWVTGWGRIDVVLAGARHGDDMVWALLDAGEGPGMTARPVRLAALDASATVELRWDRYEVPPDRVVAVEPYLDWRARDRAGLAGNGYLAVGVAARGAGLLGSDALTSELDRARRALDRSAPATVVGARAGASLLAVRAATAVVAAGGGRSIQAGTTAARLMREATFLLVFGQTPEIRAAQQTALAGGAS